MHVLVLTDYLGNVGGAELSTQTIATGLANHDDVSRVTVVGPDVAGTDRLEFPGVTVDSISLPGLVDSLPDFFGDVLIEQLIARRARTYLNSVDVIHAHHRRSTLALSHLNTDVPTVATIRDYWPVCPISVLSVDSEACSGCENQLGECTAYRGWNGITEPAIRRYLTNKRDHNARAFDGVDTAIFISTFLQQRVASMLKPPQSTVIYNPVSVDQRPLLKRPQFPLFVTASSLTKEKGIDLVVSAMEDILQSRPNARLVIFGDGPERDVLESQASVLPDEAVKFRGRVPPNEVYETIRSATATVFPSRWDEPFGRITVESMQLGTPVVGAAVGGIAEIIEDQRTGLLFERRDDEGIVQALQTLCNDEELWTKIAMNGLERGNTFKPDLVADEHVKVYQKLLTKSGNPSHHNREFER